MVEHEPDVRTERGHSQQNSRICILETVSPNENRKRRKREGGQRREAGTSRGPWRSSRHGRLLGRLGRVGGDMGG